MEGADIRQDQAQVRVLEIHPGRQFEDREHGRDLRGEVERQEHQPEDRLAVPEIQAGEPVAGECRDDHGDDHAGERNDDAVQVELPDHGQPVEHEDVVVEGGRLRQEGRRPLEEFGQCLEGR